MKRILPLLACLFCFYLAFSFQAPTTAQTPTQAPDSPPGYGTGCLIVTNAVTQAPGQPTIRRRLLSGSGFPTGVPIYIVSVTTIKEDGKPDRTVKTTGNQALDDLLKPWGTEYVAESRGLMTFTDGKGEMEGSKRYADAEGKIYAELDAVPDRIPNPSNPNELIRNPAAHQEARFFGVFEVTAPPPTGGAEINGEKGGQQLGQLIYSKKFSDDDIKSCIGIKWDPKGKVFDATSLEPMGGVVLYICKKEGTNKRTCIKDDPTIESPYTSVSDETPVGSYQIYVPAGTYYLEVTPPPGFRMITSLDELNPNYNQNNLYSDIYLPNQEIVEVAGTVQHRDVALIASNPNKSTNKELRIFSHLEMLVGKQGNKAYNAWGHLSHPRAKVILEQAEEVIHESLADNNGDYSIFIPQDATKATVPIDIFWEKTDLTGIIPITWVERIMSWFGKDVYAELKKKRLSARIEPILTEVKGYAYNSKGETIANAQVTIKLKSNNAVVYTMTADEQGYYEIPGQVLPVFPYYLTYTDPISKSTIRKETSVIAKENKLEGNYNPEAAAQYKKTNTSSSSSVRSSSTPLQQGEIQERTPVQPTAAPEQNSKLQQLYVLLSVVILLVIAGGVGAFILIKKSQQNNTGFPLQ